MTVAICLALASTATAAPPDFLLQMPQSSVASGSGAGELDNPRGIAGEQDTGHVYIADRRNARISEYTAWGLFVKAWGWGVANGAADLQTCGPAEPEGAPPPGLCQKGIPGPGKGQMALLAGGIAVDGAGNVWVGDLENLRVQKFSPAGQFLLMLGGKVNKTKVEEGAPTAQQNVCPLAPSDACQAGSPGEAPSHLSPTVGDVIAYSPTADAIVVGDKDRIQVFNLEGTFEEEVPFEGELAPFTGETVNGVDVDAAGSIYFSLGGAEDLYKLSAAGVPLAPGKPGASSFEALEPLGVAVDVEGSVYAIDDPPGDFVSQRPRLVKFDSVGSKLIPTKEEEESGELAFPHIGFGGPLLTAVATNFCPGPKSGSPGNVYLAFFSGSQSNVNAYGGGPVGCEAPPPQAPDVVAQFATAVGREEAILKAEINPLFFTDVTHFVEYGTEKCSEGGCGATTPVAGLTSKSVNKGITTGGVILEGLEPGTTYHYRFVAQSSGGGPVFGEDPDGGGPEEASLVNGLERTFATFAPAAQPLHCPANEAFRTGVAAELPDCRAYEMVSPLEKANADVSLGIPRGGSFARALEVNQSATTGERFTFTSLQAFAEPQSAPFLSQYMARRGEDGWGSSSISPPRSETPLIADQLTNEFQAFSIDLCMAWLRHNSVTTLAEGAIERYSNLYRRGNCIAPPSYEALSTSEPPNRDPENYLDLFTNGLSADGTHTIFTANDALHPDAPTTLEAQELLLYEHTPEGLRFVCYLPNGNPSPQGCAAGTPAGDEPGGISSSLRNAISADGSRVFWTAFSGGPGIGDAPAKPGPIYARIEDQETKALSTIKVSGSKAPDPAAYWTAADDGSKVIFEFTDGSLKDELYEFDVQSKSASLVAKGVLGPLGASEDAGRIYFASKEDLDAGGPASAGANNLYLYDAGEGGSYTFVATLAVEDIGGSDVAPAPVDEVPFQRAAAVSPDGRHAAFASVVSPTPNGYDNLDAVSGEPAQEVYRYDASEDELMCVSCNPTGARPIGQNIGIGISEPAWAAARIQGWEALQHAPRVITDDGNRVFFESHEALAPRDTNGVWDVYQWEEAGSGSCTEGGATYSEASGGCVDLISAGKSAANSIFLDADASGEDVFISTQSSLVTQDYGLNDVYDARVGGGFPSPVAPTDCEGETCQSPPPPPPDVTPASAATVGGGNVRPVKSKRCRKGTRKVRKNGKTRCVRKAKRASRRRMAR